MAVSIAAVACACAPIAAIADLVSRRCGGQSCLANLRNIWPSRHEVNDLAVLAGSLQQPAQPEPPEDRRHLSLAITWDYSRGQGVASASPQEPHATHVHLPDTDPPGVDNATQTWITYQADAAPQTRWPRPQDQAVQTQLWWPLNMGFGQAWRFVGGRRSPHPPPPPCRVSDRRVVKLSSLD